MTSCDPSHAAYADEATVRVEIARVQDVCHACRRCVALCEVFPTLFEMLDEMSDPSADLLTPAQQDLVVDHCVHCTLCVVDCPHAPGSGRVDVAVDVPRLMLRARAMQFEHGHLGQGSAVAVRVLARPDRVGRVASRVPAIANRVAGGRAGSFARKMLTRATGVSARRPLGTFASQSFSAWFLERPTIRLQRRQAAVTLFPTCMVEAQSTAIGKDLVKVYERNGIECSVSGARCCGAPLLHAGRAGAFAEVANANVARLATAIRSGTDVVVTQPSCAHVLTVDSADHVTTDEARVDASLVAEHTHDAAGYLMGMHRGDDYVLDTDFERDSPRRITYLASSHVRARRNGFPARDLMRLTGARIEVVEESTTLGGIWSLRSGTNENDPSTRRLADSLVDQPEGVVVADSHLQSVALAPHTKSLPQHPLQVVARAYGIPKET